MKHVRTPRRVRLATALAVSAVVALGVAPAGLAGTASKNGSQLVFRDTVGEENRVRVFNAGGGIIHVTDNGSPIFGVDGCTNVSANEVDCGRIDSMSIDLGAGDDGGSNPGAWNKTKYPATMVGGDGNDWLKGGIEDDALRGGPGNDTLNPSAGNDLVFGGAGDDDIHTRSAVGVVAPDKVWCGEGTGDTVDNDERDIIARDCETVLHPTSIGDGKTCDGDKLGTMNADELVGTRGGDNV